MDTPTQAELLALDGTQTEVDAVPRLPFQNDQVASDSATVNAGAGCGETATVVSCDRPEDHFCRPRMWPAGRRSESIAASRRSIVGGDFAMGERWTNPIWGKLDRDSGRLVDRVRCIVIRHADIARAITCVAGPKACPRGTRHAIERHAVCVALFSLPVHRG